MIIRNLTTRATFAVIGLALTAGVATAAEPMNVLNGVKAVPMSAAEMDRVQGKNNFLFAQNNGFFFAFQGFTGFIVPGGPGDTVGLTLSGVPIPMDSSN
jgi:hypothetical protein